MLWPPKIHLLNFNTQCDSIWRQGHEERGLMNEIYPHCKKDSCSLSHGRHSEKICSVQSCSHVQLFVTPWTETYQAYWSITNSQSLLKFISIESVMPSNQLILYCPLPLLLSSFPSIRFFSNESVLLIRWPKYWSFSFSISPSNKYSGLISFRMDWFDLLTVQGLPPIKVVKN